MQISKLKKLINKCFKHKKEKHMNQDFENEFAAAGQAVVDKFKAAVSNVRVLYTPAPSVPQDETFKIIPTADASAVEPTPAA